MNEPYFTRAVFRSILFGADEMYNAVVLPYDPAARTYLDDPIMVAQRRNRARRGILCQGPMAGGKPQPIRKWFDTLRNRYVTNER